MRCNRSQWGFSIAFYLVLFSILSAFSSNAIVLADPSLQSNQPNKFTKSCRQNLRNSDSAQIEGLDNDADEETPLDSVVSIEFITQAIDHGNLDQSNSANAADQVNIDYSEEYAGNTLSQYHHTYSAALSLESVSKDSSDLQQYLDELREPELAGGQKKYVLKSIRISPQTKLFIDEILNKVEDVENGETESILKVPLETALSNCNIRTTKEEIKADSFRRLQRLLDISIASSSLTVLMPLFVVIAIAIKLDSPGSVFFTQWRIGKDGKRFKIYKFRTMHTNVDGPHYTRDKDPRITRVGKVLRKTSLDELANLVNVLIGNMSVVGPRPLVTKETYDFTRENPEHLIKLKEKPGITSHSEVNRRQHASTCEDNKDRLEWETYGIKHHNLRLYILTILKTFYILFAGRGAR